MDTLRTTCRELKVKTNCLNSEDRCSTTTTSSSLTSGGGSRCKKSKKSKKKKKAAANKTNVKEFEILEPKFVEDYLNAHKKENCHEVSSLKERSSSLSKKKYYLITVLKVILKINTFYFSFKKDIDEEVESFKKSLQEFEAEFKRPLTAINRAESRSFTRCSSKEFIGKPDEDKKKNTTEK